jgi:hypothetical protein
MAITFTSANPTSTITMNISKIKTSMESAAEIQPIPGASPLVIKLGWNGNVIQFSGKVFTETDHDNIRNLTGESTLTVTTSTYPEFDTSTVWLVQKRDISRKGGYLNQWDVDMTVITTAGGLT